VCILVEHLEKAGIEVITRDRFGRRHDGEDDGRRRGRGRHQRRLLAGSAGNRKADAALLTEVLSAPSINLTIAYVRSNTLCLSMKGATPREAEESTSVQVSGARGCRPDPAWTSQMPSFSVLLFSISHWFGSARNTLLPGTTGAAAAEALRFNYTPTLSLHSLAASAAANASSIEINGSKWTLLDHVQVFHRAKFVLSCIEDLG
jgi:hypothetical protein